MTHHNLDSSPVELKWKNTTSRSEVNENTIKSKRKIYNDAAIQAAPELVNELAMLDQGVKYVDSATQTDFVDSRSSLAKDGSSGKESSIGYRPSLIGTKSKTFPTTTPNCVGSYKLLPSTRLASTKAFKKQYQDQVVQTDLMENSRYVKHQANDESKRTSVRSPPKTPDLNSTYPFPSPTPFQKSNIRRNPNRSIEEVNTLGSSAGAGFGKAPESVKEASPTRGASSPLRCAQCGAEINLCSFKEQPEAAIDLKSNTHPIFVSDREPFLETHSRLISRWGHTCTAQSSLDCQQCGPREVPLAASRLEEPSGLAIRSSQQTCHYSPLQEGSSKPATPLLPNWAATLESDLEGIIQSYHSPEERFINHKVIMDTVAEHAKLDPMADPVKKASIAKLRLRAPPAGRPRTESRPNAAAVPLSFLGNGSAPSETVTSCSCMAQDSSRVNASAVFRGLHVATAAACDEDVAKWIEEITGTGIRGFLSNLSAFDGLGSNTLAGVAKRAAKQRRREVRAWERLRETRLQEKEFDEGWGDCVAEFKKASPEECDECALKGDPQGQAKNRKMGSIAGDETANLSAEKPTREKSAEEIVDTLVKTKKGRSRESLRERAVRLGWMDRSVSGEV